MKQIPLTQGKSALVDDDIFELIMAMRHHRNQDVVKWHAYNHHRSWYAHCNFKLPNGKWTTLRLHRFVMNASKGQIVDHINHDGLDNRRSNLRIVDASENQFNSRKRRSGALSKYKGVAKVGIKWTAQITHKKKYYYLGFFDSELAAALAYDKKAIELNHSCANLNFYQNKQVSEWP